jgi:prepilin signal peptidase PulO-like enzyme (type II secretory pathway)
VKHLEAGLMAGVVVISVVALAYLVIMLIIAMGPPAWLLLALFIAVTIVAAIIDWKTEKKP